MVSIKKRQQAPRWARVMRRCGAWMAATALGAGMVPAGGVAGAVPAAPAAPAWSVAPSVHPEAPGGRVLDISCSSAAMCAAVGYHSDQEGRDIPFAEMWNGSTWTLEAMPAVGGVAPFVDLDAVSCTSATFCEAVGLRDGPGGTRTLLAEGWNGSRWTIQPTPDAVGDPWASLDGISCVTTAFCMAVGTYTSTTWSGSLVEMWNGSSWNVGSTPGPGPGELQAVTCLSTTYCQAVGQAPGRARFSLDPLTLVWDDGVWQSQTNPYSATTATIYLYGLSCTSPAFCEAVGTFVDRGQGNTTALALGWDGSTWTNQGAASYASSSLEGVACTSPTFCMAGGDQPTRIAEVWNGSGWSATKQRPPAGLASVWCASPASCIGAGDGVPPDADAWNGAGWTLQPLAAPASGEALALNGVSCPAAGSCQVVGALGPAGGATPFAEGWNGSTWVEEPSADPGSTAVGGGLSGVSCPTAATCLAVGSIPVAGTRGLALAEHWDGATWTVVPVPVPEGTIEASLASVSCTSVDACEAVGSYELHPSTVLPLAERWTGTAWALQAAPARAGTSLASVSCVTASACEAVGSSFDGAAPVAMRWNGTSWAFQPVPNPGGRAGGALSSVSCAATSRCEAVGQFIQSPSITTSPLAEVWDGATWRVQAAASPRSAVNLSLDGLSCTSAASCEAVGQYENSSTQQSLSTAEVWNGETWVLQGVRNPLGANIGVALSAISCPAATTCTAVGGISTDSGLEPLIEVLKLCSQFMPDLWMAGILRPTQAQCQGDGTPKA